MTKVNCTYWDFHWIRRWLQNGWRIKAENEGPLVEVYLVRE